MSAEPLQPVDATPSGSGAPLDAPVVPTPPGVFGAGILLAIWSILPALLGFVLLAEIEPLTQWLGRDPIQGAVIFAVAYAVCCGTGLLPTYAPSFVGGWIFGPWVAFPACVVGYIGGSTIGFAISKLFTGRNGVQGWIDQWPKAAVIRRALVEERPRRTFLLVALLRLSPSCPFSLTNLAMASSGVPFYLFLAGTIVGMAPRTLVATMISHWAAEQGSKDLVALSTDQGIVAFAIGLAVLLISLLIIGHIAKVALSKTMRPESPVIR